ncbi:PREDICTED: uncharacterized protein LOC104806020 isoform X2 [Tarenaya hassleriana]|uniref:uncharacterized protein LOC104806020 isoform X2 n=1 Tax=Tarenaya hassleriana TaxID=28532 RepID=UPI00053C74B0|nr:PREDICTED: uncharacterized protein LOC104806020 isoform X2 [Tarenaya hassleriana]
MEGEKEEEEEIPFEKMLEEAIKASEKRIIAKVEREIMDKVERKIMEKVERVLKRAGITVETVDLSEEKNNKEDDVNASMEWSEQNAAFSYHGRGNDEDIPSPKTASERKSDDDKETDEEILACPTSAEKVQTQEEGEKEDIPVEKVDEILTSPRAASERESDKVGENAEEIFTTPRATSAEKVPIEEEGENEDIEKEDKEVSAAPEDPIHQNKRPTRKRKTTVKSPYTAFASTDPPPKKQRAKRESKGKKGRKERKGKKESTTQMESQIPTAEGKRDVYVWIPREPIVLDNVVRVETFVETSTKKANALFKFTQKPREDRLWMSGLKEIRKPLFWEELLQEGVWLTDDHINEAMYEIRQRVQNLEPVHKKFFLCDVQCCEYFKYWEIGQKELDVAFTVNLPTKMRWRREARTERRRERMREIEERERDVEARRETTAMKREKTEKVSLEVRCII